MPSYDSIFNAFVTILVTIDPPGLAPLFLAAVPTSSTFSHQPSGSGGGTRTIAGSALIATYRVDTSGSDVAMIRFTLAVVGTVTNS